MNPKGGARTGAGRKPAEYHGKQTGKRVNIYLAPDLVEWFENLPKREKSEFINQAIREKIEREGQNNPGE